MADIAVSVASEVAKCLVAPVGRHCGYVIFSDRRVCELNVEVKKLDDTKDEVQHSIDDAQNNMKPIKAKVETWVKEVETVATKARDVLDYDGRAQKTCFCGWLPNPKARYRLGNEASKMIKEIKDLIVQGKFERVYDEISPPGRVGGASDVNSSTGDGGNTMLKSQASTFQDVMKALYDEKHEVIGVYGPGGVGKTTLLEMVEEKLKKEKEEKLKKEGKLNKDKEGKLDKEGGPSVEEKLNKEGGPFNMIAKSKVSQTPDLTKIQFDIAYALGLTYLKNEPSEEGRRDLLLKRLQKDPSEKVLIILDDLWGELDLKAVGIPLGNESMKCKLLLASRDKRVLEQRMHADQTFHLKSLEEDEAFNLFEKIVGDQLRDNEELKVKAAQVVTKLAGLPLLINSVASTLKYSDVSTWEDMLIKIEDPNNERIVKWSYDHLESEEAKCLFLLCGLIGGTIEVELLLGLGMGLGLFGGFDNKMQSLRNRLNTMLNSLHSFCLLPDGGDGKENVTIHDLYSEVVVSNVFSDQNSLMIDNNYGSWPKEKLEKCWACLVNVGSNRLVELMPRQFTHVKILMLSEQYNMGDCSRMDFTYLRELRVLYLGSMHITSLPSSMEILGNLRSLSISCHVEDVANLGKLKGLQILSFVGSKIYKLPKELGKLTSLRSLNLSNCYSLKIIEPGALKGLINLEELHMKASFSQWRGEHELAELKSLTKLASLEISISDPKILLKDGDLPFEKLEKFWINVGDDEVREYEGLTTMKLNLKGCDGILSRECVKRNLQKTQCLYLSNLSEFKESPRELCTRGFREVKYLDIRDSPSIKYIANSSKGLPLKAFGKLESFFLENLINLEKICHGPIAPECFNKLKAVRVNHCNQLKYLWCLSNAQSLKQLEKIEVWNCDSMQSIVTHDAGVDIVYTNNRVELPKVRELVLCELPSMKSFCHTSIQKFFSYPCGKKEPVTTTSDSQDANSDSFFDQKVTFPNITRLVIDDLPCKELWNNQIPTDSFQKLKFLELKKCDNLQRIATSYMWKKLQRCLKELEVVSCRLIEIIYDGDGTDTESGELRRLVLSDLENLRCVWQSNNFPTIPFPNLRDVMAVRCHRLKMLFPTFTAKFLGQIEDLMVESCEDMEIIIGHEKWEEAIDTTITFSELVFLRLLKLPKFRGFLPEKYSLKFSCSDDFPSLRHLSIERCGAEPDQKLGDLDLTTQLMRMIVKSRVFLQYFIALVWLCITLNREISLY
ncbi:hypothetical protein ACJRO7_026636 [Eucalyptus globulus]|uniref:AAA+ ATPase domain-containing protein n=1 Tax=Eucalyptus globulus TaxID=34317 RepID=A0ABD3JNG3_EUCGL